MRLPLFPLGTIVVPGQLLSLSVFEPRYRRLLADLAVRPADERAFGVVSIRTGHEVGADAVQTLNAVGTVTTVRRVRPGPHDTISVFAVGGRRFRVLELDPDAAPYLTAEVGLIDERDGDTPPALADRVAAGFCAVLEALGQPLPALPSDPAALSYLVAQATPLELCEQQALLELPSTHARLQAEATILRRERLLITELGAPAQTGPLQAPSLN